jgi:ankyrin repeat protein
LLLRYLGQLAYLQRLRHHCVQPFPAQWHGIIDRLESQLNISRRIRYVESRSVFSPMTLGWMKPVVLFPIGLAARLTPAEVEFILLHELAHIRRNDYLVNVLQSLVSILLFYHPAAWWLSKQLAEEREKCCDDLVVAQLGQPSHYATTLIHLQEQNLKTMQSALSVTGPKSGFSRRILRLLNDSATATNCFREGFVTAFVLIAGVSFLAVAANKTAPAPASEWHTMVRSAAKKDNLDRLIGAIAAEDEPLFLDLLKQGVNVNGIGTEGWTPLSFSAAEGQVHFARLLLNAGADANVSLPFTGTPLIIAAREGDLRMVELLLERGADVNQSSAGDGNPLIMAAAGGHAPIVRLLVERGGTVNALVEGDETPLINAAGKGHLEVVQYLVAHGADVNLSVLANPDSRPELRSPLNQAIQNGHSAVAAYLRDSGAKR